MRITVHQLTEAAAAVVGQNPRSVVQLEEGPGETISGFVCEFHSGFLDAPSPPAHASHVGFSLPPFPAPEGA